MRQTRIVSAQTRCIFGTLVLLFLLFMSSSATSSIKCSIPLSSSITTVVPNTGLVLWPTNDKLASYKDSIALEYSYINPSLVATSRNMDGTINYDWSPVEKFLAGVNSRGHAGVVRFYYVYPGETKTKTNVPDFIRQIPGYRETIAWYEGEDLALPDWTSTDLQAFHVQFFKDFATQFDQDSRLAYLQVGFGNWGEYHLSDVLVKKGGAAALKLGVNFPSIAFQRDFLTKLGSFMTNTPWSISIDSAGDEYTDFVKNPLAVNFGLFDDSFMHKTHNQYNEESWNSLGWFTNRYKTSVAGGEISYYKNSDQWEFLNPKGMYGRTFGGKNGQSKKFKLTYMVSNDATDSESSFKATPADFKSAAAWMGYRFKVSFVQFVPTEAGGAVGKLTVTVFNIGVAPPLHHHYLSISASPPGGTPISVKSTASLRYLAPGESIGIVFQGIDGNGLLAAAAKGQNWLQISSPKSSFPIPYEANCENCPDVKEGDNCSGKPDPDPGEDDSGNASGRFGFSFILAVTLSLLVLSAF